MDALKKTLAEILERHRDLALVDSRWLERELQESHPEDTRIYVLVAAVQDDLPRQLQYGLSAEIAASRLEQWREVVPDMALWAAQTWQQALHPH